MSQTYQSDFEFFPKTWVFPKDQRAFENYLKEFYTEPSEEEKLLL